MKPIAKMDFSMNGKFYTKGDEVETKSKEEIIKLNEKGFIEPLTMKQIQDMDKKPELKRILRKEEENK